MRRRRRSQRMPTPLELGLFALEANWVINLRLLKLAAGGAAATRELQRIGTEKAMAQFELHARLAADAMSGRSGHAPQNALKFYRSKVRANLRRLTRGGK
jgi:hypothetical protein